MPLEVEITGWSPFEPGDADNASLPVAALEYRFTNQTRKTRGGSVLVQRQELHGRGEQPPGRQSRPGRLHPVGRGAQGRGWEEGAFSATVSDPAAKVNHAWFRGGWWDPLTMAWKDIAEGRCLRAPADHRRRPFAGRHAVRAVHTGPARLEDHRAAAGLVCRPDQSALRQGPRTQARHGACAGELPALVRRPVRQHR